MELNQLNFSMIGAANGLANPMATSNVETQTGLPVAGGTFVNLLDLVADLELSESQGGDFSGDLQKTLGSEVVDSQKSQLEKQALDSQVSGMALSLSAPSLYADQFKTNVPDAQTIGQIQFVEANKGQIQIGNGIAAARELMAQASELNAFSNNKFAGASLQKADQLSSDSLAQWSAAIAAGDLKSVTLEDALKVPGPETGPSLSSVDESKTGFKFADQKVNPFSGAKPSAAIPQANSVAPQKIAAPQQIAAAVGGGAIAKSADKAQQKSGDVQQLNGAGEQPVFERAVFANASSSGSAFSKSDKEPRAFSKPVSVGAKSMLLEQANVQSLNGAVATTVSATSLRLSSGALREASNLGDVSDSRVSAESLKFVADKVEQLKAQGGGSIRIELAPRELGSIDVKVGMRGGLLTVEIKAENMTTQQALNSSKAELQASLGKVAPAEVTVGTLKDSVQGETKLNQVKGSASSSEQFLSSYKVSGLSPESKSGLGQNMQASSDMGARISTQSMDMRSGMANQFLGGDSVAAQSTLKMSGGQGTMTSSGDFLSQRDASSSEDKQGYSRADRDDRRDQAREKWEETQRKSA